MYPLRLSLWALPNGVGHYSARIPRLTQGRGINILIVVTMALHMTALHIWSLVVLALNIAHVR